MTNDMPDIETWRATVSCLKTLMVLAKSPDHIRKDPAWDLCVKGCADHLDRIRNIGREEMSE